MKAFLKKHWKRLKKYQFLLEELIRRDFRKQYRRAALGVVWSMLSPLLTLLVMSLVFTQFFGRGEGVVHYTTYLFSGLIIMNYFRDGTKDGMASIRENNKILTKINIPKYLFVFSENASSMINFLLVMVVYFIFCAFDGIHFGPHILALLYPIFWLTVMNVGIGLILSTWYVFFKDMKYLYDVFLRLLTYMSAIFYQVDRFPARYRPFFLLNPVYVMIKYVRMVVIEERLPSVPYHCLCAGYALFFLIIGIFTYRKYNREFIYYL